MIMWIFVVIWEKVKISILKDIGVITNYKVPESGQVPSPYFLLESAYNRVKISDYFRVPESGLVSIQYSYIRNRLIEY